MGKRRSRFREKTPHDDLLYSRGQIKRSQEYSQRDKEIGAGKRVCVCMKGTLCSLGKHPTRSEIENEEEEYKSDLSIRKLEQLRGVE